MKKAILVMGVVALTMVACKKADLKSTETVDTTEVVVKDTMKVETTITVDTLK